MSIRFRSTINFDAYRARLDQKLPRALLAAAEHVAEVSAAQTPLEEGTLVRSQQVTAGPGPDEVTISYGTPYARYQHEKLNLRHEHGNAKFLELPLGTERSAAMDILAARAGLGRTS